MAPVVSLFVSPFKRMNGLRKRNSGDVENYLTKNEQQGKGNCTTMEIIDEDQVVNEANDLISSLSLDKKHFENLKPVHNPTTPPVVVVTNMIPPDLAAASPSAKTNSIINDSNVISDGEKTNPFQGGGFSLFQESEKLLLQQQQHYHKPGFDSSSSSNYCESNNSVKTSDLKNDMQHETSNPRKRSRLKRHDARTIVSPGEETSTSELLACIKKLKRMHSTTPTSFKLPRIIEHNEG